MSLSWTASTDNVGVAGYRVERCQGAGCTTFAQVGTPSGTTFSDTGLAATTTYRYQVRAVDAAGNLSRLLRDRRRDDPAAGDTTRRRRRRGLTATASRRARSSLSWTASTDNVGVTGYRVERCQGTSCTNFAQVGTPSGTTFSNTGLAASTTYRYQVRAVDAAGNLSGYSAIATATTPAAGDTTAPSAPTALSATAITTTRIDLGWTASTDNVGVTGYRVERCQGTSCTDLRPGGHTERDHLQRHGPGGQHQLPLPGPGGRRGRQPGRLLRHRHGDDTLATDTTRPSAPTGLRPRASQPTRIDLSWTASTDNVGVTGYRVERCQGTSCTTFTQVGTPTGTTYTDTGLAAATTYRYRVRAVDAAGNLEHVLRDRHARPPPPLPTPRRPRRPRPSRPRRSPPPAST